MTCCQSTSLHKKFGQGSRLADCSIWVMLEGEKAQETGKVLMDVLTMPTSRRPAWLVGEFLMLSALPAFVVDAAVVRGLASLGVSEVWSFTIVMPHLILAWFYFLGSLLDRWVCISGRNRVRKLPYNALRDK